MWKNDTNYGQIKAADVPALKDLNTGEIVPVISPGNFVLETVLLDSAYYRVYNNEHRFNLSAARKAGLRIEKK
jgi:hypothetical protein